ncbi:MAG: 50S ribosomal protein L10, partial [Candidatus Parcubacteria bacterium]|nr:50S ribosomal protein L10 [Candidatus Parcubacteria bacterium]
DEVMPAKIAYQFSQKNANLKILGGLIESQRGSLLGTEQVIELAKLSSKEELLARLVGSIAAPMSGFANVLQGNIRNLVYVLNAIKK